MCKKVQFSLQVDFISTFANDEYDRTAQEVAKLTYKDMLELLTMKSQWRRDMERMMAERTALEGSSSATTTATTPTTTSTTMNNENSASTVIHTHHQQQEICI
ncbi:hypothetical protein BDF20DRAFT_852881 [Mycotypha africana]|uniref:uncharacterized protein n=1 Tax=Mycotypha africana TaxID=64632 RepID=UPI002300C209|nr:uncharacterized protein BDF20DRAFT_852881 [Mycotypha africana]KAI8987928.1 hypothetical protein BDF20DRAFT_852881 [Mycotypha africana]